MKVSVNSPITILPDASAESPFPSPVSRCDCSSIANTLLLNVVKLGVVGSDAHASPTEHLPPVGDIVAVDIGGNVALAIREHLLAMGVERCFLGRDARIVSQSRRPI